MTLSNFRFSMAMKSYRVATCQTLAASSVVATCGTVAASPVVATCRTLAASPVVATCRTLAVSSVVVTCRTVAASSVVATCRTVAASSVVATCRTVAASPVVATCRTLAASSVVPTSRTVAASPVVVSPWCCCRICTSLNVNPEESRCWNLHYAMPLNCRLSLVVVIVFCSDAWLVLRLYNQLSIVRNIHFILLVTDFVLAYTTH